MHRVDPIIIMLGSGPTVNLFYKNNLQGGIYRVVKGNEDIMLWMGVIYTDLKGK